MNNLLLLNLLILFLTSSIPALSIEDTKVPNQETSLVPENTNTKSEFNPKPASASLYNLGLKSYEQGDTKSAVSFFRRAIDLDPQFIDAYYNLGAIYKKQKDFPLAIDAFQKAYNISREDHEVIYELASCYFEEKSYENAKKYFSLLPQNSPKYNEAKQKIDLISHSFPNNQGTAQPETSAPVNQAQLLADTLAKAETQTPPPQAQLIVNNLAKPSKENLIAPMKTITSNFNGPTGIAKDSKNNIYIGNFASDKIERVSSDGKREVFIEKNGIKGPVGLAIDENDNLYVANYGGDSIVKVTQNKEVSVISNKVVRPYYLLYDSVSSKLFATVQGNDALVEIDTRSNSKEPITSN